MKKKPRTGAIWDHRYQQPWWTEFLGNANLEIKVSMFLYFADYRFLLWHYRNLYILCAQLENWESNQSERENSTLLFKQVLQVDHFSLYNNRNNNRVKTANGSSVGSDIQLEPRYLFQFVAERGQRMYIDLWIPHKF